MTSNMGITARASLSTQSVTGWIGVIAAGRSVGAVVVTGRCRSECRTTDDCRTVAGPAIPGASAYVTDATHADATGGGKATAWADDEAATGKASASKAAAS